MMDGGTAVNEKLTNDNLLKGDSSDESESPELVLSEDGSQQSEEENPDPTENENISSKEVLKNTTNVTVNQSSNDDDGMAHLLSANVASNEAWILKSHPDCQFNAERDMEMVTHPIDLDKVQEDEVVIRVNFLAIDAFIRTMIDGGESGTIQIGEPIKAMGVGTVVAKSKKDNGDGYPYGNAESFSEGTVVVGLMSAARYAIVKIHLLQEKVAFAKPQAALGILGSCGENAYIGTFVAASKSPRKGETVVVSAAAGPTGCLAAQMAKLSGARVIGIAGHRLPGGDCGEKEKKFILEDLKIDGAINCEDKERSLSEQFKEACPDGIDFFFDSVGGEVLDEVLNHINTRARVVICGATSQYDKKSTSCENSRTCPTIQIQGPNHYLKLAEKSASLYGFNTMDFPEHSFKATAYLGWNYMRDKFVFPQKIKMGIDTFASCTERLFSYDADRDGDLGHANPCERLLVQVSDNFDILERQALQQQDTDDPSDPKETEQETVLSDDNSSESAVVIPEGKKSDTELRIVEATLNDSSMSDESSDC